MSTVTLLFPFDPRLKEVSTVSYEDWIVFLESWEDIVLAFKGALAVLLIAYRVEAIGFAWLNFVFFLLELGPKVALKQLRKKLKDENKQPADNSTGPTPRDLEEN